MLNIGLVSQQGWGALGEPVVISVSASPVRVSHPFSERLSGLPWQFALTTTQESSVSAETLPDRQLTASYEKITLHTISQHRDCEGVTRNNGGATNSFFLIKTQWFDVITGKIVGNELYKHWFYELFRTASGALQYTCQFIWSMFAIIAFVNSCHYFLLDMLL